MLEQSELRRLLDEFKKEILMEMDKRIEQAELKTMESVDAIIKKSEAILIDAADQAVYESEIRINERIKKSESTLITVADQSFYESEVRIGEKLKQS